MESECPDIMPPLREIPEGFKVEMVKCCGDVVYYFGHFENERLGNPEAICAFLYQKSTDKYSFICGFTPRYLWQYQCDILKEWWKKLKYPNKQCGCSEK
jgi:hypothetical protein